MRLLDGVAGRALISSDGAYRYLLVRDWDPGRPPALWVMLNPSTADADTDDQTLRQVQAYSRREGAGSARVVNLFALRSSDPAVLYRHPAPVGPVNDGVLEAELALGPALVVAAWGAHGHRWPERVRAFLNLAARADVALHRLGDPLKSGQPRHPARAGLSHPMRVHR